MRCFVSFLSKSLCIMPKETVKRRRRKEQEEENEENELGLPKYRCQNSPQRRRKRIAGERANVEYLEREEGSSNHNPSSSKGRSTLAQTCESLYLSRYFPSLTKPLLNVGFQRRAVGRWMHTCPTSRKNSSRHVSRNVRSARVSASRRSRNGPVDIDTVGGEFSR
ncbi:hypothetical protein V8C37DRAFT_40517 [Trichoderma ceciliae]